MNGINHVAFRDEAGNTIAAVEWDTDEWLCICAVDDDCEWKYRDVILSEAAAIVAGHLGLHKLAGVGL